MDTLKELDKRMRKLRRAYKRAVSGGYGWLATQLAEEIQVLARRIAKKEAEL